MNAFTDHRDSDLLIVSLQEDKTAAISHAKTMVDSVRTNPVVELAIEFSKHEHPVVLTVEAQAGPHECLKDVALKVLQNKVLMVPIIHSPSEDGSFPQLLHLACLSGILKCICRHFKYSSSSLPILQLPIGSIPLGTWVAKVGEPNGQPFAMLRPNASHLKMKHEDENSDDYFLICHSFSLLLSIRHLSFMTFFFGTSFMTFNMMYPILLCF